MLQTSRPKITGKRGVVAAGHYLAASAGIKMLAKGGNAIDAGVAAGFALAVLKPNENSMGGECPILIYSPDDKKVYAISGQGTAPLGADPLWFKERNIDKIPGDGYLGATVPGLFGSYCTALKQFGRLTLEDVLEPAIDLASDGFPIHESLRSTIKKNSVKFTEEWPSTSEVFMPNGKIPALGQTLKQPALAKTFKRLVEAEKACSGKGRANAIENAISYYYDKIADDILEYTKAFPVKDATGDYHTPLLEKDDFISYKTKIEDPVSVNYKDYEVFKCGTWTQGPVFLQQLKLLEGFDIDAMGHNSAEYMHIVTECAKLAFADRDKYYGDPLFNEIPLEMLFSNNYNDFQRDRIDLDKANNEKFWENDLSINEGSFIGDTTHLDVIDSDGFMMSATPSGGWIPTSPVIPKLGFPLGTRGQMFNFNKTHANRLEPGKRPRTTLTPTLAFKGGVPWMVFGTPGGDCQDQWALQFFINIVAFDMDLQQAADAPSFYTCHFLNSFYPGNAEIGKVFAERNIDMDELIKLQEKGHILHMSDIWSDGQMCAVRINQKTGVIEGAASPKGDGQAYAIGW
jgi:gamma-glutamyltranspeptidase/glutathione hydrolase